MSDMTLFGIESTLQDLTQERAAAEQDGDSAAVIAIDKAIDEYMLREVRKVNGTCQAIRIYEHAAAFAYKEAERAKHHADELQANADRIKASALRAMQQFGAKVLETPTNKLQVWGNGGLAPLDAPDETIIPEEYRNTTVTMSLRLFWSICRDLSAAELSEIYKTVRSLDTEAIRAALAQRVQCPECKGKGENTQTSTDGNEHHIAVTACPRCEGRGTIPNTVPGAKLLPRGVHLRVS